MLVSHTKQHYDNIDLDFKTTIFGTIRQCLENCLLEPLYTELFYRIKLHNAYVIPEVFTNPLLIITLPKI